MPPLTPDPAASRDLHPLRILRARTVVPGDGTIPWGIDNGAVAVAGDRIVAVGTWPGIERSHGGRGIPVQDLGEVVLVPGLINAHTHLELCSLRGRTTLGQGFEPWVKSLLGQLPAGPDTAPDSDAAALDDALHELRDAGTACVADVCTRSPAFVSAGLERAGLEYILFHEWFGHRFDSPMHQGRRPGTSAGPGAGLPGLSSTARQADQPYQKNQTDQGTEDLPWPASVISLPEGIRARRLAAGGHALYSTDPDVLQAAKRWDRAYAKPFTIHLAEHQGEVEFLRSGTGAFADLLKQRVVPRSYRAPGLSPVAYAHSLDLLDGSTLAVHCVHLGVEDIELLARSGATVCLCPRSNEAIGVGCAPWGRLAAAGIPLCLGTDSLASNADLDLWNEARYLLGRWPGLRLADVLAMMTAVPARVLGLAGDLGALAPGRLARFAVVPDDLVGEAGSAR